MFDFFRKKKAPSFVKSLIDLPDDRFTNIVKQSFQREPPATHAMAVVAYYNLMIMIPVMERIAREDDKLFSFDDVMVGVLDHLYKLKDERNQRRFGWFLLGFSQMRLNQKAVSQPALQADCIDIWLMMATGGYYINRLLAENVVWKPTETIFFSELRGDDDGVAFVTNFMVPKSYRSDARFKALGQKHSFVVSPFVTGS